MEENENKSNELKVIDNVTLRNQKVNDESSQTQICQIEIKECNYTMHGTTNDTTPSVGIDDREAKESSIIESNIKVSSMNVTTNNTTLSVVIDGDHRDVNELMNDTGHGETTVLIVSDSGHEETTVPTVSDIGHGETTVLIVSDSGHEETTAPTVSGAGHEVSDSSVEELTIYTESFSTINMPVVDPVSSLDEDLQNMSINEGRKPEMVEKGPGPHGVITQSAHSLPYDVVWPVNYGTPQVLSTDSPCIVQIQTKNIGFGEKYRKGGDVGSLCGGVVPCASGLNTKLNIEMPSSFNFFSKSGPTDGPENSYSPYSKTIPLTVHAVEIQPSPNIKTANSHALHQAVFQSYPPDKARSLSPSMTFSSHSSPVEHNQHHNQVSSLGSRSSDQRKYDDTQGGSYGPRSCDQRKYDDSQEKYDSKFSPDSGVSELEDDDATKDQAIHKIALGLKESAELHEQQIQRQKQKEENKIKIDSVLYSTQCSPSTSNKLQLNDWHPYNGHQERPQNMEKEQEKLIKAKRTVLDLNLDQLRHCDDSGNTLLTISVVKCSSMCRALVDRMEREGLLDNLINKSNNRKETPLYLAVDNNKPDLVHILIEKGADPNGHTMHRKSGSNYGFWTALHLAATQGTDWLPVLNVLLKAKNIDVNVKDSEQKTALHYAVEVHGSKGQSDKSIDSKETIKAILQHKAKILPGPNDRTALHFITEKPDLDLLKFLVEQLTLLGLATRREVMNMKDSNGNTCLHLATSMCNNKDIPIYDMIKYLLIDCEVEFSLVNNRNDSAKKFARANQQVLEVFKVVERKRRNKQNKKALSQKANAAKQIDVTTFVPDDDITRLCNALVNDEMFSNGYNASPINYNSNGQVENLIPSVIMGTTLTVSDDHISQAPFTSNVGLTSNISCGQVNNYNSKEFYAPPDAPLAITDYSFIGLNHDQDMHEPLKGSSGQATSHILYEPINSINQHLLKDIPKIPIIDHYSLQSTTLTDWVTNESENSGMMMNTALNVSDDSHISQSSFTASNVTEQRHICSHISPSPFTASNVSDENHLSNHISQVSFANNIVNSPASNIFYGQLTSCPPEGLTATCGMADFSLMELNYGQEPLNLDFPSEHTVSHKLLGLTNDHVSNDRPIINDDYRRESTNFCGSTNNIT